ncbi:hypothetical protein AAFC00_006213 [Neodothiora populina]|uniref:Uncharacterized protein n=1 Tax=Neodothiora populina TaxID=2781224 RepID=A0ABR3P4F1_9PEZI
MIILPPPWEGLHPAFPKRPDPFNTNSLTNAPIIGGTVGLAWATGASIFRRNPASGLKAAAWATVLSAALGLAAEQLAGRIYARPYLESKGITVPKQKLVTRLLHADEDTFVVAGGIAGVLLARSIAKPWSVTGWKRAVGAFSFGAFAGDWANYAVHWRQVIPCAEVYQRQKQLKALYQEELKQFRSAQVMGRYGISIQGGSSADLSVSENPSTTSDEASGKTVGSTSMQQLLRDLQKTTEENVEKLAGLASQQKLDEEDPQPHYSEMRDGERVFRPDTNYQWTGTPEDLDAHIQVLRRRRESLKSEAELIWHKMAVKEAEYHAKDDKKEADRIRLEVMNHLHINAYLEISQLDWMIADSQKTQLQLKTLKDSDNKSAWIPAPPADSSKIVPKHTLQLLDELERDQVASMEDLEMIREHTYAALNDPLLEALDKNTGQKVADPWAAARKDLEEVEKTMKELVVMMESIQRLRKELRGDV